MSFQWTPASLVLSAVTLLVAGGFCWTSWRRSGFRRATGLLECFRMLLILLALAMLNEPELRRDVAPVDTPVLVVLQDVSDSMQTRDVVDGTVPQPDPKSRAAAAAALSGQWSAAAVPDRLEIRAEEFAAPPPVGNRGTDLATALERTLDREASLRAIVLLSDGDWNSGPPPHLAAAKLRARDVPVFAIPIGSQDRLPDLELASVDAPTFGVVGQTLRIPFRVVSRLPEDRRLSVRMTGMSPRDDGDDGDDDRRGDQAAIETTVDVGGMTQVTDTLEWKPDSVGEYELTVRIPVDPDETHADNNERTFPVVIRQESLKVLLIESVPRWEYRYLRNALERDPGVDVHCLLFHPELDDRGAGRGYLDAFPRDTAVFDYDVVFLGDVGQFPDQMTTADCERLRQLVRSHAGGLVFLPGLRGYQQSLNGTELGAMRPVIPDPGVPHGIGTSRPGRFALTRFGRRSLLMRLESDDDDNERVWNTLPGFHWYAAPQRTRAGSHVLATHDSATTTFGRVPLIVTRTEGTGKVLFMGTDGAWRWRKGVEDRYHYRFWSQVVRWMAYQRKMAQGESMRLFHSPDRPEAGRLLTLYANVMSDSGEPLRTGTVTVRAEAPSGEVTTVTLAPAGDVNWGLFTGSLTPAEGGVHALTTVCRETGARLETSVDVQGREDERVGDPARPEVLREIADITGGRLVQPSDVAALMSEIANRPQRRPDVVTIRIWSHPLWAALLILLLGLFWTARKAAGLT